MLRHGSTIGLAVLAVWLGIATPVGAQSSGGTSSLAGLSNTEIAHIVQNPLADVTQLQIQNNANFNAGTRHGIQDVLNLLPIIPFHLDERWNLITRSIIPLQWNPPGMRGESVPFGTQAATVSAYLSPKDPINGWVLGAGPVVQAPTTSSSALGSSVWGLGPAAVLLKLPSPGVPFRLTLPIYNVTSLGGSPKDGTRYNLFYANPNINYNFGDGWYISSSPIITAEWDRPQRKWSLPIGMGLGKAFHLPNGAPVVISHGFQYYLLRPEGSGTWLMRTQVALLF
jgi:hypothetical protein